MGDLQEEYKKKIIETINEIEELTEDEQVLELIAKLRK